MPKRRAAARSGARSGPPRNTGTTTNASSIWPPTKNAIASTCSQRIASQRSSIAQLDQAAGGLGVARHERRDLGLRADPVEQPARDAAVERADDIPVLARRRAVRAVAQAIRQLALAGGLE